jgi:hypothetical protein
MKSSVLGEDLGAAATGTFLGNLLQLHALPFFLNMDFREFI